MLKKIALALVLFLGALLIFAAMRPDSFRVERSISIKAPPEKVYALIDDFHRWQAWSPWEKLDPAMKRTHGGPPSGVGATYAWQGNDQVGEGRMEITEAVPASNVTIKLDFIKPFEAHNIAQFALKGEGGSTNVTWAMHGPSPFLTKLMNVFISMDSLVGKDFETGLANMKAAAER